MRSSVRNDQEHWAIVFMTFNDFNSSLKVRIFKKVSMNILIKWSMVASCRLDLVYLRSSLQSTDYRSYAKISLTVH